MYDWTDDLHEQARLTFPRLAPEIDSLMVNDMASDLVLDLLLNQHPLSFQC
jgi:hypothetical protein